MIINQTNVLEKVGACANLDNPSGKPSGCQTIFIFSSSGPEPKNTLAKKGPIKRNQYKTTRVKENTRKEYHCMIHSMIPMDNRRCQTGKQADWYVLDLTDDDIQSCAHQSRWNLPDIQLENQDKNQGKIFFWSKQKKIKENFCSKIL